MLPQGMINPNTEVPGSAHPPDSRRWRLLSTWLLSAWLVVSASGCGGAKVFVHSPPGAHWGAGKTFAVAIADEGSEKRPMLAHVRSAIERELSRKGYTKAPLESAQLVVSFYVKQSPQQEVTIEETDCYARNLGEPPPGTPWENARLACEKPRLTEFEEGTLVIGIYDAADRQLLWQGWTSRRMPSQQSETTALMQRAASDILTRLPSG